MVRRLSKLGFGFDEGIPRTIRDDELGVVFLKDDSAVGFFAYLCLKKVAYESIATFFILRICIESNRHSHP